jgi:hypothetical protein
MLGYADTVVGGAVLMSPHLLVTCAHVVNAALGRHGDTEAHPGPEATVRLLSFDDRVWTARVLPELWSAGEDSRDLAVLRLAGPGLPDTGFPVLSESATVSLDQTLYTAGYPAGMRSLRASLSYQGQGGPTGVTHQVETPASRSVQITGGFSGCAVRTETGELVGIMQKNHRYPWADPDQPSGAAFMLPVEELVGERGADDRVSVQRLADESLCGRETYSRLHDLLDSVPVAEVAPEALLRSDELRRIRQHGSGSTAWRILTALWDVVPPAGEPPPRVVWVHHVYQELVKRRPLPPLVWPWIRQEAYSLGPDWAAELARDREQRLLKHRRSEAVELTDPGEEEPGTVVLFDLEPVTGGYKVAYGIVRRDGDGNEPRILPQQARVVDEDAICDEIGDLMGEAAMRRLITPDGESLRLSFVLPRDLLHLSIGQASPHRDLLEYPPRLATMYEITYHVRERRQSHRYMAAHPDQLRRRSEQQRGAPWVEDPNVRCSWEHEIRELANALGDPKVTVCIADSDSEDIRHVYDASLHRGVPTIIRGPAPAIRRLATELLGREPGSRVRISGLARYLRDRARENVESRDIALIHDVHGDGLPLWPFWDLNTMHGEEFPDGPPFPWDDTGTSP